MEVDRQLSGAFTAPVQGILSEVTEKYQPFIEKLYSLDSNMVLQGAKEIKNFVIGNNKRKTDFIVLGAVPRLVYLLQDQNVSINLKIEAAIVLGSLAKGIDASVQNLLDHSVAETLFACLATSDLKFYESCIRCLRTIITSSDAASKMLYINSSLSLHLMLQNLNKSVCAQQCTCEIISHCCKAQEHQDLLLNLNILTLLGDLLVNAVNEVIAKALDVLTVVCFKNPKVCEECANTKVADQPLVGIIIKLLAQSQPKSIQLRSAKCLTFIYRTETLETEMWNDVVVRKVLPCLVRMCDDQCTFDERINGAEVLAYLTESDPPLQRLSYICEQFPQKLQMYFRHPTVGNTKSPTDMKNFKYALKYGQDLRRVGLLCYASLLSNDEDIRKQVSTEALVKHVAESMMDSCVDIRVSALKCLLSLSRSIHLLRTTFQDVGIWKAFLKLVHEQEQDIQETKVISSILCNMMLDFFPNKNQLMSADLLSTICKWLDVDCLKLNAIWCLMNMSFQAETQIKLEILAAVGFNRMLGLLTCDDRIVIVRTLGLLRNALHQGDTKVAEQHGANIIQACKHLLTVFAEAGEGHPSLCIELERIRAHTVCVLACMAAIDETSPAQNYLQVETELLQLIVTYLVHFDINLQMAAVTFIYNFVRVEPLSVERQTLLIDFGAVNGLQQLQSSNDTALREKVEKTLECFQSTKM